MHICVRHLKICLVEKMLVHFLEELMIVSVIDSNANQDRAGNLKSLLQRCSNLIGRLDHEAGCSKRLGILDDIHWPEVDSRCAFVLWKFLDGNHVVGAVDPNHMNEVELQPHGSFEFHRGKQESSVARDGQCLFVWSHQARCDSPGQGDAQRLLAIADQDLPRSEAEKEMRHPKME